MIEWNRVNNPAERCTNPSCKHKWKLHKKDGCHFKYCNCPLPNPTFKSIMHDGRLNNMIDARHRGIRIID